MVTTETEAAFSQWAILELMGHRRLAGLVTEQQIAGHGFLRLDVPAERKLGCVPGCVCSPGDGSHVCEREEECRDAWFAAQWQATQFYSPTSVYCLTPVTEEVARQIAADSRPQPATRWELERSSRDRDEVEADVDEYDEDDDDL